MKTSGSAQSAAMLIASPNAPVPVAPSPKKQTVTSSTPLRLHAVGGAGGDRQAGADDAVGAEQPDLGHRDVHRAAAPARVAGRRGRAARPSAGRSRRPWPGSGGDRGAWRGRRRSAAGCAQPPTATASWPIDRCSGPGTCAVAELVVHRLLEAAAEAHHAIALLRRIQRAAFGHRSIALRLPSGSLLLKRIGRPSGR